MATIHRAHALPEDVAERLSYRVLYAVLSLPEGTLPVLVEKGAILAVSVDRDSEMVQVVDRWKDGGEWRVLVSRMYAETPFSDLSGELGWRVLATPIYPNDDLGRDTEGLI